MANYTCLNETYKTFSVDKYFCDALNIQNGLGQGDILSAYFQLPFRVRHSEGRSNQDGLALTPPSSQAKYKQKQETSTYYFVFTFIKIAISCHHDSNIECIFGHESYSNINSRLSSLSV